MGKQNPKYVDDSYAKAKADAVASGNVFSGTKYDYYNHPNNKDGVRINEMEESAIKKNYKSFNSNQSIAACRKFNISYNTNGLNMNKAGIQSALGDYFAGRDVKVGATRLALKQSEAEAVAPQALKQSTLEAATEPDKSSDDAASDDAASDDAAAYVRDASRYGNTYLHGAVNENNNDQDKPGTGKNKKRKKVRNVGNGAERPSSAGERLVAAVVGSISNITGGKGNKKQRGSKRTIGGGKKETSTNTTAKNSPMEEVTPKVNIEDMVNYKKMEEIIKKQCPVEVRPAALGVLGMRLTVAKKLLHEIDEKLASDETYKSMINTKNDYIVQYEIKLREFHEGNSQLKGYYDRAYRNLVKKFESVCIGGVETFTKTFAPIAGLETADIGEFVATHELRSLRAKVAELEDELHALKITSVGSEANSDLLKQACEIATETGESEHKEEEEAPVEHHEFRITEIEPANIPPEIPPPPKQNSGEVKQVLEI